MATLDWRQWSADSFAEADRRDVPILLAIMTPWNASSRRMDEETYGNEQVALFVEGNLVPIRVSSLERPDIAARYSMGADPTTAFLTPQGHLLTGTTFLTPGEMLSAIERVVLYYAENKAAILAEVTERERQAALASEPQGLITTGTVTKVERALVQNQDREHGGFKVLPKRIWPDCFLFSLLRYFRTNDVAYLSLGEEELRSSVDSPIRDRVAGGFFHMATQPDWSGMLREKLCVENAVIISALIRAARVTEAVDFEDAASEAVSWALSDLAVPGGGFWVAQIDDEKYYEASESERSSMGPPPAVEVIEVESSAAMATACLDAAVGLGDKKAGKVALETAERLWREGFDSELGMAHTLEPMLSDRVFGLLGDQLRMLELLLRAFEVGGHPLHQRRAVSLAGLIETLFADPGGGFYDRNAGEAELGQLKFRKKSIAANGLAARVFQQLGALTHNDHFKEVASAALRRFTDSIDEQGIAAAPVAYGCDLHMRGIAEVMVLGERSDRATARLRLGALEKFVPATCVNLIEPSSGEQTMKVRGVEYPGAPVAYIYRAGERLGPYDDKDSLGEALVEAVRQ